MKMSKITAFLVLCAGFSAFAGGSLDNTPLRVRRNVNNEPLLSSAGLMGGSYALYKKHMNAINDYYALERARIDERYLRPGFGKSADWRYFTPAPDPKRISLKTPIMAGVLGTLGVRALYKWYNSNVRNPYYYPTKR